jgi:cyclophilin family peptidyl-prolyl cis-trans isomerase
VPSADKRARKKENARAAREQREAAERRRKRTRSTIIIGVSGVLIVGLFIIATVAGNGHKKSASSTTTTTSPATTSTTVPPKAAAGDVKLDPAKTYKATIATNFGNIVVTLDAKHTPIGAGHFVTLAKNGVYNGSRWHRIIKGFVIQGGAPGGDPNKDYGKAAVGEVPTGAYKLGDIAAAKTGTDPNGTFDAQFFIVTGPQGEQLPPDYADFGTVTSGLDVVRKIEALKTDASGEPSAKATIDKVTISES